MKSNGLLFKVLLAGTALAGSTSALGFFVSQPLPDTLGSESSSSVQSAISACPTGYSGAYKNHMNTWVRCNSPALLEDVVYDDDATSYGVYANQEFFTDEYSCSIVDEVETDLVDGTCAQQAVEETALDGTLNIKHFILKAKKISESFWRTAEKKRHYKAAWFARLDQWCGTKGITKNFAKVVTKNNKTNFNACFSDFECDVEFAGLANCEAACDLAKSACAPDPEDPGSCEITPGMFDDANTGGDLCTNLVTDFDADRVCREEFYGEAFHNTCTEEQKASCGPLLYDWAFDNNGNPNCEFRLK